MAVIRYSGSCGTNATWTFDSDGVLTVSGTGPMTDYSTSVPEWRGGNYGTLPNIRDDIRSVVIEPGITTVGNYAFDMSRGLAVVLLADSVVSVGTYAFSGSSSLTSLSVGSGVASIARAAFEDCDALQTIYYNGSPTQWAAISIAPNNDPLLTASIQYTNPLSIAQYYIDSVNITPYLLENGVQESTVTRRGREVVLLDGTKRRWQITKRSLSFSLRTLRMSTLHALAPHLSGRVSVTYDDSVYGHTTRDFYVDGLSDTVREISGGNTWVSAASFTLEEV